MGYLGTCRSTVQMLTAQRNTPVKKGTVSYVIGDTTLTSASKSCLLAEVTRAVFYFEILDTRESAKDSYIDLYCY
jgi:hypothetical protein